MGSAANHVRVGPSPALWHAAASSVCGAAHMRRQHPNEDAVSSITKGSIGSIAVADGHGDARCPRAAVGAQLAVSIGVSVLLRELADATATDGPPADVEQWHLRLRGEVTERVLSTWRLAVATHEAGHPFDSEERSTLLDDGVTPEDQLLWRAYGTTLLIAAADARWLLLWQLGDGELGVVLRSGATVSPLPEDDRQVGGATLSLATTDADGWSRCSALSLSDTEVVAVWACTDGFSAAQVDPAWRALVGRQLLEQLATVGAPGIDDRLAAWLEPAAATAGDDTSMALLMTTSPVTVTAADRLSEGMSTADRDTLPPRTLTLNRPEPSVVVDGPPARQGRWRPRGRR